MPARRGGDDGVPRRTSPDRRNGSPDTGGAEQPDRAQDRAQDEEGQTPAAGPRPGPAGPHATKYLASGWWQMMASVVCSGFSWNPSVTVTPMRSPPSSSTTLALSVRSGQAG